MTEEKALLNFAARWDEAIASNDVGAIGSFMSSDWIIVGADGMSSKAAFLRLIADGLLMHSRMDADETHVKLHGDTGIVVARGTSEGTYNSQPFSLYEWSTSVFVKNDGKWLCVATHLTPARET